MLCAVPTFAESLSGLAAWQNQMVVPDLWQQQAVTALREGQDVVVQAPTGAGKTLIFELWSNQGRHRGQAIYTVPTRALANDKLAEWRARGWDVGIATGDLADNLEAPVLVATLETQKNRLIRGGAFMWLRSVVLRIDYTFRRTGARRIVKNVTAPRTRPSPGLAYGSTP